MAIEYIGELLSDEHLSVTPAVLSRFSKGEPLKMSMLRNSKLQAPRLKPFAPCSVPPAPC